MIFDRNEDKPVIVLVGAGSMGTAIVRRIGAGAKILLGDISAKALEKVSTDLKHGGFDVETQIADASDKKSLEALASKAAALGRVMTYIHTAGASPNQASPEHIISLDLVGTSYALDAFGNVIAKGGAGLVISSQAGHMPSTLTAEEESLIALTPTDQLVSLAVLGSDRIDNSGLAYIIAKRANQLRVRTAAATTWGDRGARINSISPGIIVTPLAYDEFNAAGDAYQQMIDASAAKRTGTSEEIAGIGAFLLGPEAAFITGTDILVDGGVIAAIASGRYKLHVQGRPAEDGEDRANAD